MKIYDVLGNSQRLDGGALFGNAPKALWGRWFEPDEHNRIGIACRALLVDTGTERILLETGIGCFFPPALRDRFGVVESDHRLLESLAAIGLAESDIDAVVLSHLHFDHAGGLLSKYEDDKPARLHFPNARFVVGAAAFARAEQPHPRDRASFIPELQTLLRDSGRLRLVPEEDSQSEFLPRDFLLHRTSGHTPSMLHTELCGSAHRVFFCADLIPGRAWIHAPITMGYDRFPEGVIDEKLGLLPRFEAENTWLFFTHDPSVAASRIAANAKGKFCPTEVRATFQAGWDLNVESSTDGVNESEGGA